MRDTFVFYRSWLDVIEKKYGGRHDIKKSLYLAIIQYGITGEATYPAEDMFLMQVYAQIDSARAKHDARVEAGRKGGQAGKGSTKARPGNKNASKRKQTQPNDNVNDNDNVNGNVNVNNIITSSDMVPLEWDQSSDEELFSEDGWEEP